MSWKQIKVLAQRCQRVGKAGWYYRYQLKGIVPATTGLTKKELRRKVQALDLESGQLTEQVMMACWPWVESGQKLLTVAIHDWLEDNLGISKFFEIRAELWYRAVAWEFSGWRLHLDLQHFDAKSEALQEEMAALDKEIDEALEREHKAKIGRVEGNELQSVSIELDAMMKKRERLDKRFLALDIKEQDYYQQEQLLYHWLELRGFKLSSKDVERRLLRSMYFGQ